MESLYRKHVGIIRRLAHSFSNNPQDFAELMSVGNEAFVNTIFDYDSTISKATFSTTLFHYVRNGILDYLWKESRLRGYDHYVEAPIGDDEFFHEPLMDFKDGPEDVLIFRSELENKLDPIARTMLGDILSLRREILAIATSFAPTYIRKATIVTLTTHGWDLEQVNQCFSEIKNALISV